MSWVVLGLVGCGQAEPSGPESGSAGASTGGSAAAAAGTSSSGSAGVTGSDADPVLCGGAYEHQCAPEKVCVFDSGCGTAGHCTIKPTACDKSLQPVCGCNGLTYSNACEARRAGVSPQRDGECDTPSQFNCGFYGCAKGQYCFDKGADSDDLWRYACLALPEACAGKPSCDCLGDIKGCATDYECGVASTSVIVICQ